MGHGEDEGKWKSFMCKVLYCLQLHIICCSTNRIVFNPINRWCSYHFKTQFVWKEIIIVLRVLALLKKTVQMVIHRVKKKRLPREQAKPFFYVCVILISPPKRAIRSFKSQPSLQDKSDVCHTFDELDINHQNVLLTNYLTNSMAYGTRRFCAHS